MGTGGREPHGERRSGGGRIDEELGHHLAELRAQLEAGGMTPEAAHSEALRRLGDPERIARATWAAGRPGRGLRTGLGGDLLQAVRALRRAPAFAGAVVITLALALGATITVAGVVHRVLLRPMGFAEPDRLVALVERHEPTGTESSPTSRGTFQDWRAGLPALRDVAGWEWLSTTLEDPERPEELLTVLVSPTFFSTLGIRPALGRAPAEAEVPSEGWATLVVLSDAFWARRFARDPSVVGRTLVLDGVGHEVVGVLPPDLPIPGAQADVLVPSALRAADPTNRGGRVVHAVGRLAPEATPAEADAQVRTLTEEIARTYPNSARDWSARALPLRDHLVGDVRRPVLVAFAGVALLLLVAAVNVANLTMVRAADGRRELAVRAALGAGRGRLVRIRMAESLVLAGAGGVAAVGVAAGLQRLLVAVEPGVLPTGPGGAWPEPAAVAFGLAMALGVGIAVGAWPALGSVRAALADVARGAGGSRDGMAAAGRGGRVRELLVVAQLAVTVVLLVGAGLLVRTVLALRAVDPGFDHAGVVAARVAVDHRRYEAPEARRVYWDDVLRRVRALPGVEAAGLTSALPMDPVAANFDLPARADHQEGLPMGELPQADFRIVGEGFGEALGLRLLAGRHFEQGDAADGPLVGIVNRSFVEVLWPELEPREAVGRRFQMPWTQHLGWHEVIGIVEDTRFYGPAAASRPEMLVPARQVTWNFMTLTARTSGDPALLAGTLERVLVEVDPLMPPQDVFQVGTLIADATASERFYAALLAGFALLGLALAAAGIYGVLAYGVRLRAHELGVRLALGARRGEVVGMVVGRGVAMAALGVALGLAGAVPATRAVEGMLFGVTALDPLTLATGAALLLAVAAAACLVPARRAAGLDPVRVLRDA